MWTAYGSYLYLIILFWVGYVGGYYMWRVIKRQQWEDKLTQMKFDLMKENPVVKELESRLNENKHYLEAKFSDIEEIMTRWRDNTNELAQLERKLAEADTAWKNCVSKIDSLKKSGLENDKEFQELSGKHARLSKILELKLAQQSDLKEALSEKDMQLFALERDLVNLQKKCELKQSDYRKLEKELKDLEGLMNERTSNIGKAQGTINELRNDIAGKRNGLQAQIDRSEELQKTLGVVRNRYDEALADAEAAKKTMALLADQKANLEKQVQKFKNNRELRKVELERNRANILKSIEMTKEDEKKKHAELQEAAARMKEAQDELTRKQKMDADLGDHLKVLQKEYETWVNNSDKLMQEVAALRNNYENMMKDRDDTSRTAGVLNENVDIMSKRIAGIQREIEKTKKQLALELERTLSKKEKSLELNQREASAKSGELADLTAQLKDLNKKHDQEKKLTDDLKDQCAAIKLELAKQAEKNDQTGKEVMLMKRSREQLAADEAGLVKTNKQLLEANGAREKKLAALKQEIQKHEGKLPNLSKQVDDALAALRNTERKLAEKTKSVELGEAEEKAVAQKMDKLDNRLKSLEMEHAGIEANLNSEKEKLAERTVDDRNLDAEILKLERETAGLLKTLESNANELKQLQKKSADEKQRMDSMGQEIAAAENKVISLTDAVNQKKNAVSEKESMLMELGASLKTLKNDEAKLKSRLANIDSMLKERKAARDKKEKEAVAHESSIPEKIRTIKTHEKTIADTGKKLQKLQDKLEEIDKVIAARESEPPQLVQLKTKLDEEISELRKKQDEEEASMSDLTADDKALPAQIEKLKTAQQSKQKLYQQLKQKEAEITGDLKATHDNVVVVKEKSTALDGEIEDYRKLVQKLERQLEEKNEDRNKIIADREKIDAQLTGILNMLNIVRDTVDESAIKKSAEPEPALAAAGTGTIRKVVSGNGRKRRKK